MGTKEVVAPKELKETKKTIPQLIESTVLMLNYLNKLEEQGVIDSETAEIVGHGLVKLSQEDTEKLVSQGASRHDITIRTSEALIILYDGELEKRLIPPGGSANITGFFDDFQKGIEAPNKDRDNRWLLRIVERGIGWEWSIPVDEVVSVESH